MFQVHLLLDIWFANIFYFAGCLFTFLGPLKQEVNIYVTLHIIFKSIIHELDEIERTENH